MNLTPNLTKAEIRNPKSEGRIPISEPGPVASPSPWGEGRGEGERVSRLQRAATCEATSPRHPSPVTRHPSPAPRHPSPVTRHISRAFTLIELLIVIAIMAILAGLTFPAASAVHKVKIRSRARAEMNTLIIAIERYKAKMGHYPPDNPARPDLNPLYYELLGTTNDGTNFKTLDGVSTIKATDVRPDFGVDGFVNCTRGNTGDEASSGTQFLKELKPAQYLAVTAGVLNPPCTILGGSFEAPSPFTAGTQKIDPWCYNSTNPTNNPRSFDLWIDIMIGGKTNRICNWSEKAIVY